MADSLILKDSTAIPLSSSQFLKPIVRDKRVGFIPLFFSQEFCIEYIIILKKLFRFNFKQYVVMIH